MLPCHVAIARFGLAVRSFQWQCRGRERQNYMSSTNMNFKVKRDHRTFEVKELEKLTSIEAAKQRNFSMFARFSARFNELLRAYRHAKLCEAQK